tara:strand:- start:2399 stop:2944 length:546 start_codon:yes stop_codon:yes gene_type:complete
MSYVVSIDVGIKNLGICVFDFSSSKFVCWKNCSLVTSGRYIPSNNVNYIRSFINEHSQYLDNSVAVLIERQMRCNMRIIESVLHALYFDNCIIIQPRAVKMHYDLGTKNYRHNKDKAVSWVKQFLHFNRSAFTENTIQAFEGAPKKDDLADALIMVLYYLDTYSKHLDTHELEVSSFDVDF